MKKKQVAKIVGIIVIIGCVAGTTAFAGTSKMKVAVAAETECNYDFKQWKGRADYGRFNVRSVYGKKLYSKSF